jgi:hypothetical protein
MARLQLTVCMFALHAACMRSDCEPPSDCAFRSAMALRLRRKQSVKEPDPRG